MELFIAGGCGEHGRNCFYVEQNSAAFLVDCGLLAGAEDDLPRLTAEQIQKLRAVFLTHSHADHTGALPWLAQQGYQGPVYATLPTLTQLPFSLNHIQTLESLCPCKGSGSVPELPGLQVTWGRSGHCAGSVWLRFEWNGKSILFSGDYAEHSPLSTPVTRCGARRQIWPFWMRLTAARTQTGTLASKNSVWRPCSA